MATVDFLRVTVIAISVVVAVIGSLQWRRWPSYGPENQLAWLAIAALNAAMGLGTLEAYLEDAPGGFRNYLTFLAMVWLLAAVLFHPIHKFRARRQRRSIDT